MSEIPSKDNNPDFRKKIKQLKQEKAGNLVERPNQNKLNFVEPEKSLGSNKEMFEGISKKLGSSFENLKQTKPEKGDKVKLDTSGIKSPILSTREKAINYFTNTDITAKSVNDFLHSENMNENSLVPEFLFGKNKKNIIEELQKEGPITSPIGACDRIAKYIKSHLKYSGIDFLQQIPDIKSQIKDFNNLGSAELIDKIYNPDKFGINKKQFVALHNITTKAIKQLNKINPKTQETIDILNRCSILNSITEISDPTKLTSTQRAQFSDSYVYLSKLQGESTVFLSSLKETKDVMLTGIYEISDMLNSMKIGVCRHFSMIAKELYQELIKGTQFEQTSELLYVLGSKKTHAWNLLYRQDDQGQIQREYFDLTRYISGGKLEGTAEIENSEDGEFWVKNKRENSNTSENKQIG